MGKPYPPHPAKLVVLTLAALPLLAAGPAAGQSAPEAAAPAPALAPAPDTATALPGPAPPPVTPAPPPAAPNPELVSAQVGTRLALRVQNPDVPSRLGGIAADGEADVVLRGRIHPFLRWQAGFLGSYGPGEPQSRADLLDLVAKVEMVDAFNVWIGRMPMPSDRASLSTVWALSTWTLPGVYLGPTGPLPRFWPGPRYGTNDRGDGVTVWGQLRAGKLKYYAGAYDLDQPNTSPLYSARVSLSLLSPEPGYRVSSGYYGGKNVLALGVGAQHKAGGPRVPATMTTATDATGDFNEVNADLLFEMNAGAAGVVDVESAFHQMWDYGDRASYQFFALASYLVPIDIGIGRFQPLLRYQGIGDGRGENATNSTIMDAQLGYIVDGYGARLLASYQYIKISGVAQNAVLIGLQLLSRGQ